MKNIRYFIQIVVFTAIWFFVGNDISAQNEYNYILLDDGIALNFNNNPMSVEKRNHTLSSASICDNDGELMLYCNIEYAKNYDYSYYKIYDKNDNVVYEKKISSFSDSRNAYGVKSPNEDNAYYFFTTSVVSIEDGSLGTLFIIAKIKYLNGEYEVSTNEFYNVYSSIIPYIYNEKIYIFCFKNGRIDICNVQNTNLELVSSWSNSKLKLLNFDLFPCAKFNKDLSKLFYLYDLLYIFDYDVEKHLITGCKTYNFDLCYSFEFSKDYNYIYFVDCFDNNNYSIERCRVSDLINDSYNMETIWSQKINSDYADFLLCKDGNIYVLFSRDYQKEKMRVIKDTESLHPTVDILDVYVNKNTDMFPKIIRTYSSFVHNVICNNVDFEYVGYPAKSLKWNFGDNTITSNLKKVSHTYEKSGKYNVSLEAILHDNTKKSFSKEIEVNKLKNLMIQRE